MKACKKYLALLLSVLMVMLWPAQAMAAGPIDLDKEVSLTLVYRDGRTDLWGAEFDIYQIALAKSTGELVVNEEYEEYIERCTEDGLPTQDAEQWRDLAATLEDYFRRDGVEPYDSGETNRSGRLTFPTEGEMEHGLYLVLGHRHRQNSCRYDAQPFLVMLPTVDVEENVWIYDVESRVKFEKVPYYDDDDEDTVTRKVRKVWLDEEFEYERPPSIEVELLRNGRVYDTVTLSEANNWQYTWRDLDEDDVWTVVEKSVPDDYYVMSEKDGITITLTNGYNGDIPPGDPPPHTPPPPDTPPPPNVPQTGQLNWPIPVLTVAGLFLFGIGWLLRFGRRER